MPNHKHLRLRHEVRIISTFIRIDKHKFLTLFGMLANTVLHAVPLAVDG
jgi:hypothetical protein